MFAFTDVCWSLQKAVVIGVVLCLALTTTDAVSEYETCCAVQKACDQCSSLYKVNSITYCCPGCQGDVLVTSLICTCRVYVDDPRFAPNCTVSNKVLGDYYSGPTSWYSAGNLPTVSAPVLLLGLAAVQLGKYWSGQ